MTRIGSFDLVKDGPGSYSIYRKDKPVGVVEREGRTWSVHVDLTHNPHPHAHGGTALDFSTLAAAKDFLRHAQAS